MRRLYNIPIEQIEDRRSRCCFATNAKSSPRCLACCATAAPENLSTAACRFMAGSRTRCWKSPTAC